MNKLFVENRYILRIEYSDKNMSELVKYCDKVIYVSKLSFDNDVKIIGIECKDNKNLNKIHNLSFIYGIEKERYGYLT